MRTRLSINGRETWVASARELRQALSDFGAEVFKEIWLGKNRGPSLCALLNGKLGWLMYMRTAEEGLQSINPDFAGDPASVIQYRLSNGQMDVYPESWTLAESVILSALEYFIDHAEPAPFVAWRSW